ncbi:hypothetical protein C8J57DRAFT_1042048, partial [Mycena rebaudengoi]
TDCGDPTNALPFYRCYNPTVVDHFYTTDVNKKISPPAMVQFTYPLQGVAAHVFVTQEASTVPFYRLVFRASGLAQDNFYTISTVERDNALKKGYTNATNEPFTFIYPTQVCGSVPFYRLYHTAKADNFYTTSESERLDFISNQGYADVEIAGYVLPATPIQCA